MPSGGHGGGGGGHFGGGGGFHGSGHGYRGSGSVSRRMYMGHPVFIYGGRSYYHEPKQSRIFRIILLISFAFVLAAFFLLMSGGSKSDQLDTIKEDYSYYHRMIAIAKESDSTYVTDATIVSIEKRSDSNGKYYYNYEFGNGTATYPGFTYCTYTEEDVENRVIYVGMTVRIALDGPKTGIDRFTDSVQMDFINYQYQDDGQYQSYHRAMVTRFVAAAVCGIIAAGGFVAYIVVYHLTKKEVPAGVMDGTDEKPISFDRKPGETQAPAPGWECRFCGNHNKETDRFCQGCGAERSNGERR